MLLALTNVIYKINSIHDARIHVYKISTLSSHAGIVGDRRLEPYFLPPRPTGAVYRDFLRSILPRNVIRCGSAC